MPPTTTTTESQPPPTMDPPLTLLTLPPEIRNIIHDLVLNSPTDSHLCPFIFQTSPHRRAYTYSLTQTCRQLRHETLAMFHATKTHLFALRKTNVPAYREWLERRPLSAFQSIRRVRLEDYQHFRREAGGGHRFYCKSAITINLAKAVPVGWRRDPRCLDCPAYDPVVERVRAVVGVGRGEVGLTRERLEEVFEAAGWHAVGEEVEGD